MLYLYYGKQVLSDMKGRDPEMKDAAKVALRCPCWTISTTSDELETVCKLAGYSGLEDAKALYSKLAENEQKDKLTEGKAPAQVTFLHIQRTLSSNIQHCTGLYC
jgi:hypothetical protein